MVALVALDILAMMLNSTPSVALEGINSTLWMLKSSGGVVSTAGGTGKRRDLEASLAALVRSLREILEVFLKTERFSARLERVEEKERLELLLKLEMKEEILWRLSEESFGLAVTVLVFFFFLVTFLFLVMISLALFRELGNEEIKSV